MNPFWWGLILYLLLMAFGVFVLYRAMQSLKAHINGRITQLIESTRAGAEAKGIKEGRAEVEAEHKKEWK
jgi:predicted Holliday junction resolvase-like endonuclease